MEKLKKFLIISSYAPPAISGSPLMMYNLLRHFPEDSFVILTSHFGIDNKVIREGKWLKAKYFYFDTPTSTSAPQKEESLFQKFKGFIKRFRLLRSLVQSFFLLYLPFNIVRRGRRIIEEENIKILLGYSDYGPALLSSYLLHRITKKPLFLFFYDLYRGNNFSPPYKILACLLEPRLFRAASKIFVMNEALKNFYQKKYKRKDIVIIHNSIPVPKSRPSFTLKPHEPYRIVFTGTVYWPQAGAIRNLIRAINTIKKPKIQLWLYTPHTKAFLNDQGIFESQRVIFASGLPSEMPDIQKSADILFVPLAFKTKSPLLIATSSPGKTSEYLVSSRPILIHAPKDSYISRYAKEQNFALVVDKENNERLRQAIIQLISNRKLTEKLVNNAWQTALLNHDAQSNARVFRSFFEIEKRGISLS